MARSLEQNFGEDSVVGGKRTKRVSPDLCSLRMKSQSTQETKAGRASDLESLMWPRPEQQICILRNRRSEGVCLSNSPITKEFLGRRDQG